MTQELKTKLEAALKEEATDHAGYLEKASMAESAGDCVIAGILRDIAHDEETHKDILEKILNGDIE